MKTCDACGVKQTDWIVSTQVDSVKIGVESVARSYELCHNCQGKVNKTIIDCLEKKYGLKKYEGMKGDKQ